jgi:hypothetical protein
VDRLWKQIADFSGIVHRRRHEFHIRHSKRRRLSERYRDLLRRFLIPNPAAWYNGNCHGLAFRLPPHFRRTPPRRAA